MKITHSILNLRSPHGQDKTDDANVSQSNLGNKTFMPDFLQSQALKSISLYNTKKMDDLNPFLNLILKNLDNTYVSDVYSYMSEYNSGKISLNEFLNKCSQLKIKSLFKDYDCSEEQKTQCSQTILGIINKGSVQSSNLEMIMSLVEENKLSPVVLLYLNTDGLLNDNAEADLDKLYQSFVDGTSVKDIFVPEFESEDGAVKTLNTGDVCRLEGKSNIHIKMEDNSLKELFISPETFLDLFPPVERYICSQSDIGDCFLLSSLMLLYSNPSSRYKVLELFKENPDGKISTSFAGYEDKNGKVVKRDSSSYELNNAKFAEEIFGRKYPNSLSQTIKGIRMLEILYNNTMSYDVKTDIEQQNIEFYKKKRECENREFVYINGLKYTLSEIDDILSLMSDYSINPVYNDLISVKVTDPYFDINPDDVKEVLEDIENAEKGKVTDSNKVCFLLDNKQMHLFKQIMLRYDEYFKRTGEKLKAFSDIIPIEIYACIRANSEHDMAEYIAHVKPFFLDGGKVSHVLNKFGYKTEVLERSSDCEKISNILSSNDFDSKYIISCSNNSNEDTVRYPFLMNHAYILEKLSNSESDNFVVREPHNSMQSIVMSKNDILKYFTTFDIAYIK